MTIFLHFSSVEVRFDAIKSRNCCACEGNQELWRTLECSAQILLCLKIIWEESLSQVVGFRLQAKLLNWGAK